MAACLIAASHEPRRLCVRKKTLNPTLKIAVVDDDEHVRAATAKLLRLHHFDAYQFASAEEFLASPLVEETDGLVSDVRMPGLGGLELQKRLIASGQRIPVVFVTAFPDDDVRTQATVLGALCVLTKPFDGAMLVRSLETALASAGDARP